MNKRAGRSPATPLDIALFKQYNLQMDKHLNCFLSYNHDNELIENNLTRTFIVTLMGLSNETRKIFLYSLNNVFELFDFSSAKFALQNNIEVNPMEFDQKYIVTISTDTFCYLRKEFSEINKAYIKQTLHKGVPSSDIPEEPREHLKAICFGSIPDAWIYDGSDMRYCFLVECKKQSDHIYYPQILRHAYKNFNMDDIDEVNKYTVRLTWYEVLEGLLKIIDDRIYKNEQEKFIVMNFVQYLGFFEYSKFDGFNFADLPHSPQIRFSVSESIDSFRFKKLVRPSNFKIMMQIPDSNLFIFTKLGEHVNFKITCKGGN